MPNDIPFFLCCRFILKTVISISHGFSTPNRAPCCPAILHGRAIFCFASEVCAVHFGPTKEELLAFPGKQIRLT